MAAKKKKWVILLGAAIAAIALMIGEHMFNQKNEETKRNRQYEVSLVKALKNSYEGIEEIEISSPSYSDKPSDVWGAVKIYFNDHMGIEEGQTFLALSLAFSKVTKKRPSMIKWKKRKSLS